MPVLLSLSDPRTVAAIRRPITLGPIRLLTGGVGYPSAWDRRDVQRAAPVKNVATTAAHATRFLEPS